MAIFIPILSFGNQYTCTNGRAAAGVQNQKPGMVQVTRLKVGLSKISLLNSLNGPSQGAKLVDGLSCAIALNPIDAGLDQAG